MSDLWPTQKQKRFRFLNLNWFHLNILCVSVWIDSLRIDPERRRSRASFDWITSTPSLAMHCWWWPGWSQLMCFSYSPRCRLEDPMNWDWALSLSQRTWPWMPRFCFCCFPLRTSGIMEDAGNATNSAEDAASTVYIAKCCRAARRTKINISLQSSSCRTLCRNPGCSLFAVSRCGQVVLWCHLQS